MTSRGRVAPKSGGVSKSFHVVVKLIPMITGEDAKVLAAGRRLYSSVPDIKAHIDANINDFMQLFKFMEFAPPNEGGHGPTRQMHREVTSISKPKWSNSRSLDLEFTIHTNLPTTEEAVIYELKHYPLADSAWEADGGPWTLEVKLPKNAYPLEYGVIDIADAKIIPPTVSRSHSRSRSRSRSRARAKPAPRAAKGLCPTETGTKYRSRKSPPHPTNNPYCHDTVKRGNDDACWKSVGNKNGVFSWKRTQLTDC